MKKRTGLFQEIKANVTMYQVLDLFYMMDVASIRFPDPFTEGSEDRNFTISPSGRTWTYFNGEEPERGSVIDFYAKKIGITPREAAEQLDDLFMVTRGPELPKRFITDQVAALRARIGSDRPDIEQLFVDGLKQSFKNGQMEANYANRFGRRLFNIFKGVYDRAMEVRNKKRQEVSV